MPGLGTSFGRGGATMALQDLANADAILIMGSSMAENHPVGFRWVIKARERGATVIHVDPRFNRTSAMADVWAPLRAGTDIVFLGALVNHVLTHGLEFRQFVVAYTNAPAIINDDFKDTEDLDGLFSGWDPEQRQYSPDSWAYKSSDPKVGHEDGHGGHAKDRGGEASPMAHDPPRDPTLQDPRCVFQILKRHFARYTPAMVQEVCGVPPEAFQRVADAYIRASGPERTGAICYAVGWTQHSTGVQTIRTAAILQLLLGNIGRPGGGILALRGHASIQGSTDIPTLYDVLPGYLPMPTFAGDGTSLDSYIAKHRLPRGWWGNLDRYIVSLLKAWYGDAATAANDYGFDWLPRISGDHSHFGYWLEMADATGTIDGLFVMGQNPAVGAPNARLARRALANLKWLVVRDLVELETATFWLDSPEIARGEMRTEDIATEVFFFPAAAHTEKDGCFTNTQRLLQWHERAVEPPGDARSEAWFMYHLGRRLKARAAADQRPANAGLNALTWNYRTIGPHAEPDANDILQEINGRRVADRSLLPGFHALESDGSTSCGCWIYSGVYPSPDRNRARERKGQGRYGQGWGFAWPADRRILYNRASARPDGTPWSDRKKLVWWDRANREWVGHDTPDFGKRKAPDYVPPSGATGDEALRGDAPFIMHADGMGWIWVPSGVKDGPLPTHYEPLESVIPNQLYSQQSNPVADRKERPDNPYAGSPLDPRYPHVLMTYRLTEHHTSGAMSRTLSHLAELQPEFFCEISPELASNIGAANGQHVTISTPRGSVVARALVTARMRPLRVHGRAVHQVGLPYHWGYRGLVRGDVANDLLAISEEPTVRIFESKGLVCRIEVRGPRSEVRDPRAEVRGSEVRR
ncbi:MAG: formate dehydrogenase [Acidobacteria bacterium]|nr:MAG: formate dehydrogenase [Acidobacteriota bacterium]